MPLTSEQILNALDRQNIEVDVPEWGGTVLLRPMSGLDRDRFEREVKVGADGKMSEGFRRQMLVRCLVNEAGEKLFDESAIGALGEKNAAAISRLFDKCMALNGFTKDATETVAKNSENDPSGAST